MIAKPKGMAHIKDPTFVGKGRIKQRNTSFSRHSACHLLQDSSPGLPP